VDCWNLRPETWNLEAKTQFFCVSWKHFKRVGRVLATVLVGVSILTIPPDSRSQVLQAAQPRGQLVIAVKDNLRPMGFRNPAGQLQGFEIDIARRLAQELLGTNQPETAVVLQPVLNQERLPAILQGKATLIIARVTATSLRSRLVSFSIPYYLDGTALVTRDPSVTRATDLSQSTIAVLNNSSTVEILRYRLPRAKLVAVESYTDAHALLERGGAIAFAADASVLSGWVQEFPQYRLLSPTLSTEPLCIAIPKGLQQDELRRRINAILTRWQSEGWLQERAKYWGLP
jgi:polar amino acid transport system substrate-binding protein